MIEFPPAEELPEVEAGRLPTRYGYRMQDVLLTEALELLHPGVRVLDVGSGRLPTIPPSMRPPGVHYTGLDISSAELAAAPPGSYDEAITHDITDPLPSLQPFDLVVSWQVLEHVGSMRNSLEHLRDALRPGGTLLAQTSGAFSVFALPARVLPHRVRVALMSRLLGHAEDEKFPTRYDRCWASALDSALAGWSAHELRPFYRGAPYLRVLRPVQRLYLRYENVIAARDIRNLASHYLIVATR